MRDNNLTRVDFLIPQQALDDIDRLAESFGVTRNKIFQSAMFEFLARESFRPLSITEFALAAKVSVASVRKWIAAGILTTVRVGRRVRIPIGELNKDWTSRARTRKVYSN